MHEFCENSYNIRTLTLLLLSLKFKFRKSINVESLLAG